jgi:hypothetical protein
MRAEAYPVLIVAIAVTDVANNAPLVPAARAELRENLKAMALSVDAVYCSSTGVLIFHVFWL